ncbi:YlbF family regulator [Salisediminibacterium halotolerans]|uniref:YlbF family regulator n=1 Tax=Salisediminibacterium halotolerans TaxID=517425 RepID=UPI000EB4EF1A|nr:YlbF family regulator [Salisediminibacterium halotolerans]GEL08625.1 regulator [Salisediminibacterium halotolerans]
MVAAIADVNIMLEADELSESILSSEIFNKYIEAKQAVQNDPDAQNLLQAFQSIKADYEEVQRFGKYHPDFKKVTKEVREKKRQIDSHPLIAEYKIAEEELEKLLNEICETIAYKVSPSVKVPSGNPFFDQSCGGCGSGGSCGCS